MDFTFFKMGGSQILRAAQDRGSNDLRNNL